MVLAFCATILFALLSVSIAEEAEEGVSHSLPNVHQTKTVEKYKEFTLSTRTASLEFMTAKAWIQMTVVSNNEALRTLKPLTSEPCRICTMIENAQRIMKTGSETRLHVMTALAYETESLKALLYRTATWDSNYVVVTIQLTRAVASLVSAAVLKNATSQENQEAARGLLSNELDQPATAKKAVELADKVLIEFVKSLPEGALNPPHPLLNLKLRFIK